MQERKRKRRGEYSNKQQQRRKGVGNPVSSEASLKLITWQKSSWENHGHWRKTAPPKKERRRKENLINEPIVLHQKFPWIQADSLADA